MQNTCKHCKVEFTKENKPIREWCAKCYAKLISRGEILPKNGVRKCKDCNEKLVKGNQQSGRCLPCNRKFTNERNRKIREGEYWSNCRSCAKKLDKLSYYGLCSECKASKALHKVNLKEKDYKRIKLLCIKWKWGLLRPDEIYESLSLWCDCCDIQQNRNIDTLSTEDQIIYIFSQFNYLIKREINI